MCWRLTPESCKKPTLKLRVHCIYSKIWRNNKPHCSLHFKSSPVKLPVEIQLLHTCKCESTDRSRNTFKEPPVDPLSKELLKIPASPLAFESTVVTAGGEGSNLGLAGTLSLAGWVSAEDTQWPSLLTVSLLSHTAAHWNPSLSVSSIYITPNSTTNTSLSGRKAQPLEIGMWLENKYLGWCLYLMFGCLGQSIFSCRLCIINGAWCIFRFLCSILGSWFVFFFYLSSASSVSRCYFFFLFQTITLLHTIQDIQQWHHCSKKMHQWYSSYQQLHILKEEQHSSLLSPFTEVCLQVMLKK